MAPSLPPSLPTASRTLAKIWEQMVQSCPTSSNRDDFLFNAMDAFLDPSLPIWMEINSTCPIDSTSSGGREIIYRKDKRADVAWAVRGQEQRLFRQAADQVLNKGPIITLSLLGENPLHIRLAGWPCPISLP